MIDLTKIPVNETIRKYKILKKEVNDFFKNTVKETPKDYTFQLIPYKTKKGIKYSLVRSTYDSKSQKIKTRSLGSLDKLGLNYETVIKILKKQTEMKELKARIDCLNIIYKGKEWKSKRGQERKLGTELM